MTEPTNHSHAAEVAAVIRAAAADEGELYPTRLGIFCDRCEDTFEADFIVSITMTKTERLGVIRRHMVTVRGWRCDATGDYCADCKDRDDVRRPASA